MKAALADPVVDRLGMELAFEIRGAADSKHIAHLAAVGPEAEPAEQVTGEQMLALALGAAR
jgi:hypothetical protein